MKNIQFSHTLLIKYEYSRNEMNIYETKFKKKALQTKHCLTITLWTDKFEAVLVFK